MPGRPALRARRFGRIRAVVVAVALVATGACGDDGARDVGDARAEQVRSAAIEAGLGAEVADFLALAARGETADYRVSYPGAGDGQELHIVNRPPDRRVDSVVDGTVTEVRLVVDGVAVSCTPGAGLGGGTCERTDAFVDPPGIFTESAVDELTDKLAARTSDFELSVTTMPVAGVDAACLVTSIRAGRARPGLGDGGTICLAPSGALLLVDQGDERLEAIDYQPGAGPDGAFERPDQL